MEALLFAFGTVATLIAILWLVGEYEQRTQHKFFIEEYEKPLLHKIGLDSYVASPSEGGDKHVIFYHSEALLKTSYSFNTEASSDVFMYSEQLNSLVRSQNPKIKSAINTVSKMVTSFIKKSGIEAPIEIAFPLVLIFGYDKELILKAVESGVSPAVLAAIVEKNGTKHLFDNITELTDLPLSWLSHIYNFDYEIQQKATL